MNKLVKQDERLFGDNDIHGDWTLAETSSTLQKVQILERLVHESLLKSGRGQTRRKFDSKRRKQNQERGRVQSRFLRTINLQRRKSAEDDGNTKGCSRVKTNLQVHLSKQG